MIDHQSTERRTRRPRARRVAIVAAIGAVVALGLAAILLAGPLQTRYWLWRLDGDPALPAVLSVAAEGSPQRQALARFVRTEAGRIAVGRAFASQLLGTVARSAGDSSIVEGFLAGETSPPDVREMALKLDVLDHETPGEVERLLSVLFLSETRSGRGSSIEPLGVDDPAVPALERLVAELLVDGPLEFDLEAYPRVRFIAASARERARDRVWIVVRKRDVIAQPAR